MNKQTDEQSKAVCLHHFSKVVGHDPALYEKTILVHLSHLTLCTKYLRKYLRLSFDIWQTLGLRCRSPSVWHCIGTSIQLGGIVFYKHTFQINFGMLK